MALAEEKSQPVEKGTRPLTRREAEDAGARGAELDAGG